MIRLLVTLRGIRRHAVAIMTALVIGAGWSLLLLLDWWLPLPMAALYRQPAVVVTDRDGAPLRIFLPADEQLRLPVTLGEVAPVFVRALIASEDRWFYYHLGVNPVAIVRALWTNIRHGKVVSGASTISRCKLPGWPNQSPVHSGPNVGRSFAPCNLNGT
jgi:penicillin-binding protein 1C